jgi:hypothetical protein
VFYRYHDDMFSIFYYYKFAKCFVYLYDEGIKIAAVQGHVKNDKILVTKKRDGRCELRIAPDGFSINITFQT